MRSSKERAPKGAISLMKHRWLYHTLERGQIRFRALLFGLIVVLGAVAFASQPQTITVTNTAKHLMAGGAAVKAAAQLVLSAPSEDITEKSSINILVLGRTGPGHIAPDLTDTIVVVSYEKSTRRILVLSIPRDLLVKIPDGSSYTKINALYAIGKGEDANGGINLIQRKVAHITGLTLDYYVLVDIVALEQIIDSLGGINVYALEDIADMRFPTPEGGYETFSLEKGWRYLDGKTATKYVRTRHTPRGDFDRVKRQQQVIEALRKKVRGLNPITDFPKYIAVYETLNDHLTTNVTVPEAKALWYIAKSLPQEAFLFKSLEEAEGANLLVSKQTALGRDVAYALLPVLGTEKYDEIQKKIGQWLKGK